MHAPSVDGKLCTSSDSDCRSVCAFTGPGVEEADRHAMARRHAAATSAKAAMPRDQDLCRFACRDGIPTIVSARFATAGATGGGRVTSAQASDLTPWHHRQVSPAVGEL
jgi:hypothetical protein